VLVNRPSGTMRRWATGRNTRPEMRIKGMYESNKAAENENGAVAAVRTAAQAVSRLPLRDSIEHAVQNYVSSGRNDGSLYEEVLSTMEHPLLDAVMQATRGNQTRAAVLLGINRGTLRKKLKKYGIN